MYISQAVVDLLAREGVDFDIIRHTHTHTSVASARAAKVRPETMAKAVVLRGREDFLLALVPATRRVDPYAVGVLLHDDTPSMADEGDLAFVFRDCERGAVPAMGTAFGMITVVDEALLRATDIYFEGGDHEHLVHVKGGDFARIMVGQPHGPISC